MSLSREARMRLMALADGELEGEERAEAEKLAAGSEEARRIVESMQAADVGRWLAEAMDPRLGAADGIADGVMAKLGADGARAPGGSGQPANVIRFGDEKAKRSRTPVVVGGLVGLLAVAAAAVLYVQAQSSPQTLQGPVAIVQSVAPPPPATTAEIDPAAASLTAVAAAAANEGLGVSVDEIDSPAHDVTVFEIPASGIAAAAGQAAPSSVVIMISDEPVKP
ncbi:MAG TPA: hypothetical protein VIF09_12260 [Polyangiaceae bacterium]|jgi:hypothetical protein